MPDTKPFRETDLSPIATDWLHIKGYKVFAEVYSLNGYHTDLVGVKRHTLWAVELKRSLTKGVMGQALRARLFADYVWIVVYAKPAAVSVEFCYKHGIGLLRAIGSGQVAHMNPPAQRNVPHPQYHKEVFDRVSAMEPGGVGGKSR